MTIPPQPQRVLGASGLSKRVANVESNAAAAFLSVSRDVLDELSTLVPGELASVRPSSSPAILDVGSRNTRSEARSVQLEIPAVHTGGVLDNDVDDRRPIGPGVTRRHGQAPWRAGPSVPSQSFVA
jgi:hypothetical protein